MYSSKKNLKIKIYNHVSYSYNTNSERNVVDHVNPAHTTSSRAPYEGSSLGTSLLKFVISPKVLVTTALLVGTFFSTGLFSSTTALAQSAKNATPEALLSLEFNQGTELKTVTDSLKKSVRNINSIDIMSIGSTIDFGSGTQTFVKSNDDQVNSSKFVDSFKKNQVAFVKTLATFKVADSKGQSYESKEAIQPLVKKYTKDQLDKTTKNIKNKNTTINSMMISGSLTSLTKIKKDIVAKSSYIIDIAEQTRQADAIKAKADKETTPEAKLKVLNEETSKLMQVELDKNPELKAQSANAPKLESLSQETIKSIDNFVKKDINGNNIVNQSDLTKLGLSATEVVEVTKAMDNYNKMPLEIKDGSSTATQAVSTTSTNKEVLKNENTPIEKLSELVANFGSVKAEAAGYGCYQANGWINWSGVGVWISGCIKQAIINGTAGALYGIVYTAISTFCAGASVGYGLCVTAGRALAGFVIWGARDWLVNSWYPNGVSFYMPWNSFARILA